MLPCGTPKVRGKANLVLSPTLHNFLLFTNWILCGFFSKTPKNTQIHRKLIILDWIPFKDAPVKHSPNASRFAYHIIFCLHRIWPPSSYNSPGFFSAFFRKLKAWEWLFIFCVCFTVFDTGRSSPILILGPLKTASRNLLRLTGESNLPCSDVVTELQLTSRCIYGHLSVSRQWFIDMYERLICLFILCEQILPWCEARPTLLLQTMQGIANCTTPSTRDFGTVCKTLIGFVGHIYIYIYIYIYSSNAMKWVKVRLFPSKPCWFSPNMSLYMQLHHLQTASTDRVSRVNALNIIVWPIWLIYLATNGTAVYVIYNELCTTQVKFLVVNRVNVFAIYLSVA